MKWKKLGRIFVAEAHSDWMHSHASNPFAVPLHDGNLRIYFSTRDVENRSCITYLDIHPSKPGKILRLSEKPVLVHGEDGAFDDRGVTISCISPGTDGDYLYYLGWNLDCENPFQNFIGLAKGSAEKGHFRKFSSQPILSRCDADPITLSYPYVIKDEECYRMWYGSHLCWQSGEKDMQHVIKYAESADGMEWEREGHIAIPLREDETGVSRPSVIRDQMGVYHMWYSCRDVNKQYTLGYAISQDGKLWKRRDDEVGIGLGKDSFDDEMVCYPHVFEFEGWLYMLYSGNSYGLEGFGLAVLDS